MPAESRCRASRISHLLDLHDLRFCELHLVHETLLAKGAHCARKFSDSTHYVPVKRTGRFQ